MRTERTPGTVAIHDQIADALRERIETGDLRPGDLMPSVREVQEQWGCSDGPVRDAFAILKAEGMVSTQRGKPAIVREPSRRIRLSEGWSDEQKALVHRPRAEREVRGAIEMVSGISMDQIKSTHDYDVVEAGRDLAEEFGIPLGTELQRRVYEMTDRSNGRRLSWSVSYIPLELIAGNPKLLDSNEEPWPGGHQHQLYTVGIELARFVRSVIATVPTPGDRQRWGMEAGVPLLRVRSRSIDVQDRVVELSDAVYPADRTEIMFAEHLSRWPADHPRFDLSEGDK